MPPVSRSEFASRLARLDREAFARFVADLWAARGFHTEIDDGVVRAISEEGGERVLWVAVDAGWLRRRRERPPREVDAVVSNSRRPSARAPETEEVITADELREMMLYAIDRSVGEQLCRRFLDCSITRSGSASESLSRSVMAEMTGDRAFVLAGGLALLVIAAGILAAPIAWDQSSPEVTPAPAANSTPIAFETPTVTPTRPPEPEISRTPVLVEPGLLPPGISRRGIDDAEALARAHAFGVSRRSYELTLTYREFNGSMRGTRERIVVENATSYASDIITAGPLSSRPFVIADREVYADGNRQFARIPTESGVRYEVTPIGPEAQSEELFAERVGQYVYWFLTVEDSFIRKIETRNGTRFYQVMTRGDPQTSVENATGIAVIESHGVVHFLRRVYSVPGSDGKSVTITIEYTDFGNTSVEAPRWYPEAVTATKGTASNTSQAPSSPTPTQE